MKKINFFLRAFCTLLVLVGLGTNAWADASVKTETFENYTATSTYNEQVNLDASSSSCGIAWFVEHGTVATNDKISGSNSLQMRAYWAKNSAANVWNGALPYLESKTAITGLTNISFKTRTDNLAMKFDVYYKTDEVGATWTQLGSTYSFTQTGSTGLLNISEDIPSSSSSKGYFIKIAASSTITHGANPTKTGNIKLVVDDIVFTYTSAPAVAYTVTFNAGTNGTCSTSSLTEASAGAGVNLPSCTANTGYKFLGWTATEGKTTIDAGLTAGATYKPSANTTLYAVYAALYQITIEDPTNGSLSVKCGGNDVTSGDYYAVGEVINIEATPADGYKFRNIQVVDATTHTFSASNTKDWTMADHVITIKANFDVIPTFTVAWSVNGSVVKSDELLEGAEVTAPADPEDINGKVFTGWIETATVEGATPAYVTPITTATKTVTYYAVFATQSGSGAASLTKLGSSAAFSAGDKIAIFAKSGDNYYGLYQETVSNSYVAYYVLDHAPTASDIDDDKKYVTLSEATSGWYLGDETNGYLYNNSNNMYASTNDGEKSVYTITWNETNSAFTIKMGSRWIACRADLTGDNQYKYRGAGTSSSPATNSIGYLDIYLYTAADVTYSDYCTIVAAPTTATITLNAACHDAEGMVYGTYSNTSAWYVSEDLIVSEVGVVDGKLLVQEYKAGDLVPANTGVLVSAMDGGDYEVDIESDPEIVALAESVLGEDNALRATGAGITAEAMASADAGSKFYRLTMHNGTQIGFYWGAADGAAFALAANKAYLAVSNSAGINSMLWFNTNEEVEEGITTDVEHLVLDVKNGTIYDLMGRVVASPLPGHIYIQNGEKYLAK